MMPRMRWAMWTMAATALALLYIDDVARWDK